ncbi:hypothetical protein [Mameliella alba]|uniref:hypothetical protein n=1 Tax=Mameliella alba TaxID=561184 RepID=UPI00105623E4|nr:hypothetical protein [Mameliella alba]GGF42719.1 hypothetical protein GCM10011319_00630 [Mameliella alba]
MNVSDLNGIYAGFFSGSAAEAIAIFAFIDGKITGGDLEGTKFDGRISTQDNESYSAEVRVFLPAGGQAIQGVNTGKDGLEYDTSFKLESDFLEKDFIPLTTPLGKVNMRLQKIRDL